MIKVMIADDMESIRRLYMHYIAGTEDIQVVADVASGAEAVVMADKTDPDVILMDIEMETKDAGLRAMEQILHKHPNSKIIVLTVYEEDDLIFTAFQLGVRDYVLKNAPVDQLLGSIRDVYRGTSSLRPELSHKILSEFQRVKTYETSFMYAVNIVSDLTRTELDVLQLLLEHRSRREICGIRCVSMSTLKTQIRSILAKFHKKNTDEVLALIEALHLQDFILNSSPPQHL